jgi:hypothetical protein
VVYSLFIKALGEIRRKVDEKGLKKEELGKAATKSFQNVLCKSL